MKELKNQKIWVCWKYAEVDGRITKKPFAVTGMPTGTDSPHKDEWSTYDEAVVAAGNPEFCFDGVGFVMPEGVFLLDIDHKDSNDPIFTAIRALFPTYTEISPSGHGYHIYGRADLTRIPQSWNEKEGCWKLATNYYSKNSEKDLEIYIGGLTNRFGTFTGNMLETVDTVTECTDAVLTFLDTYMKKPEERTAFAKLDTERFIRFSEDQIPEILDFISQIFHP